MRGGGAVETRARALVKLLVLGSCKLWRVSGWCWGEEICFFMLGNFV